MPLEVHTARLPHHKVPGCYTGPDGLNVTRGTGGTLGAAFAPSRPLLDAGNACKKLCKGDAARLDFAFAWYAVLYREEMLASYRTNRAAWEALLRRRRVVLLCYCGTSVRCHRSLLAGFLVKLGASYAGEVVV